MIQFGEIQWWFLANTSEMAFHDADTRLARLASCGKTIFRSRNRHTKACKLLIPRPTVAGGPAPSNPPAQSITQPTVTIGGLSVPVLFSGLTPGFVGLYQVNVQVPANAPPSSAATIKVQAGNATSNSVVVAIVAAQTGPVQVTPSSSTALIGQTQQFSAVVNNAPSTAVTWAVNGVTGGDSAIGTISASGLYQTPDLVPSAPSVTITATSQVDASLSGAAQVTLIYPQPNVTSVNPPSVQAASGDTPIAIAGAGFTKATTLTLGGQSLAGTFFSQTSIGTTVPAWLAATTGSYPIIVSNPTPGGGTASSSFVVGNLVPVVTSLDPSVILAGAAATRVIVAGANFLSSSSGLVNGLQATTVFVSPNQLVLNVPTESLSVSATLSISVANPAPGGGTSNNIALVVSSQTSAPDLGVPSGNQDGIPDPEALVYFVGSTAATGPSAALARLGAAAAVDYKLGDECVHTQQPRCDSQGGTPGFGGVCVPNVKWVSQIPPGTDWSITANCGPTSLSLLNGAANNLQPTEQNIRDVNEYLKDYEAADLKRIHDACAANGTCKPRPTIPDIDVDSPGYGPIPNGIDSAALARTGKGLFGLSLQSTTSADSSTLEDELRNNRPVIVHVLYEMNENSSVHNAGHYMVLVGMDQDWVYVTDPGRSAQSCGSYARYPRTAFEAAWQFKGNDAVLLAPRLGIVSQSLQLPDGQVNLPYSAQFSAAYGTPQYTWSARGLPDGLTLDSRTGLLSGTPRVAGQFSPSIQVADQAGGTATGSTSMTVNPGTSGPLTITTPASLPSAQAGIALQLIALTAAGGVAPYSWQIVGTGLPSGLSLSVSGQLAGTAQTSVSNASFTAQVSDSSSPAKISTKLLYISVVPAHLPPTIYSLTASPSSLNVGGSSTLICVAANPQHDQLTYTWTATGGVIVGSGSTAQWTAPSQPGQYKITCAVADATGAAASADTLVSVSSLGLGSAVSPNSGVVNSTQFLITGSGAKPNGGVTSTTVYPDDSVHIFKTTADGSGKYSFGPFTEAQTGLYTESESDDSTGAKSAQLLWRIDPSTSIVLTVAASCATGGPQVQLQWTDVSAMNYDLYRNGTLYASAIVGTKYSDSTSLVPGSLYNYSIQAHLANGTGQTSNSATVTVPATCSSADLVPLNIVLSNAVANPGTSLIVTFAVANQGNGLAGTSTSRLWLSSSSSAPVASDPVLADVSTPSIGAGGTAALSANVTIPSATVAGTFYVWAKVDNAGQVSQSNTANDLARSGPLAVNITAAHK